MDSKACLNCFSTSGLIVFGICATIPALIDGSRGIILQLEIGKNDNIGVQKYQLGSLYCLLYIFYPQIHSVLLLLKFENHQDLR